MFTVGSRVSHIDYGSGLIDEIEDGDYWVIFDGGPEGVVQCELEELSIEEPPIVEKHREKRIAQPESKKKKATAIKQHSKMACCGDGNLDDVVNSLHPKGYRALIVVCLRDDMNSAFTQDELIKSVLFKIGIQSIEAYGDRVPLRIFQATRFLQNKKIVNKDKCSPSRIWLNQNWKDRCLQHGVEWNFDTVVNSIKNAPSSDHLKDSKPSKYNRPKARRKKSSVPPQIPSSSAGNKIVDEVKLDALKPKDYRELIVACLEDDLSRLFTQKALAICLLNKLGVRISNPLKERIELRVFQATRFLCQKGIVEKSDGKPFTITFSSDWQSRCRDQGVEFSGANKQAGERTVTEANKRNRSSAVTKDLFSAPNTSSSLRLRKKKRGRIKIG